jgi:O-acetyl-ADP-ribose deacetylase
VTPRGDLLRGRSWVRTIAVGTSIIRIHRGDITMLGQHVGAIVNPANDDLRPSGAICSAIHEFGGPEIAVECLWIGKVAPGRAVVTTAGRLLADCVIHAVGPIWKGGTMDEDRLLAATYRNSLDIAAGRRLRSIAFPTIGTGIVGFPIERAATIAIGTAAAFLRRRTVLEEVIMVSYSDADYHAYEAAADRWEQLQLARTVQARAAV